jgi:hypothetical protein
MDAQVDGAAATAGQQLREGQLLTAGSSPACLRIEPGVQTCVQPGGALRIKSTALEQRELELVEGRAVATLQKQPQGTRFSIRTGKGLVTAVGTVFAVDAHGGRVRARVHEGLVLVELPDGEPAQLREGEALELGDGEGLSSSRPEREDDLAAVAAVGLWREAQVGSLQLDARPIGARVTIDGVPVGRAPLEVSLSPGRHQLKLTAAGRQPLEAEVGMSAGEHLARRYELLVTEKRRKAAEPKPQPSAADLMDEARELRASGRLKAAVKVYRKLVTAWPESPQADLSRVALGDLTLQSSPAEALESYEAYLKAGDGALVLEARFGRIRALKALGRESEARAEAAAFVRDHPSSMQARALKAQLDAGP